MIRYGVEERIGRAEPGIKHCNRAGKRHGFEAGVMHRAVKFLIRLVGGHQLKKIAWRDGSERSIICEVTQSLWKSE